MTQTDERDDTPQPEKRLLYGPFHKPLAWIGIIAIALASVAVVAVVVVAVIDGIGRAFG